MTTLSLARPSLGANEAVRPALSRATRREIVVVAATLMVAGALRLALASQGWPPVESDEATVGLMAEDILRHGAHPLFFYGQHYMGALQAYLAVPFFAVLGPTSFALHVTTTVQTLFFLLFLYLFTRIVYSPGVAWWTLTLLSLGPGQALFYELRAGVGAQDTLVFGALLLWLVVVRVRRPTRKWTRLLLELGIGVTVGLGLWGDLLMVPFAVAAAVALGLHARCRWDRRSERGRTGNVLRHVLVLGLGTIIGLVPFLLGTLASGGVIVHEVGTAAGVPGTGDAAMQPWMWGLLVSLGQQVAAVLLVGLPHALGLGTVCGSCAVWPFPLRPLSVADIGRRVVLGALFSGVTLGAWLVEVAPYVRAVWSRVRLMRSGVKDEAVQRDGLREARWWGRAMLVLGGALTVLEYIASRSAYDFPATSARYLVGVYLCTPLLVEPLWRGSQHVWWWLKIYRCHRAGAPRLRASAACSLWLLGALMALHGMGLVQIAQEAGNRQDYGVPANVRDRQLLTFLQHQDATRFYTTYWACARLMFEAQEQVTCSVISATNPFAPGLNRISADAAIVDATPHPAYVFDRLAGDYDVFDPLGVDFTQRLPDQLGSRLASGDPRFAGYRVASFSGFLVYYYAGST